MPPITSLFLALTAGLWLTQHDAAWAAVAGVLALGAVGWRAYRTSCVIAICGLATGAMSGHAARQDDMACRRTVVARGVAVVRLLEPLRARGGAWGVMHGRCRLRVYLSAGVTAAAGTRLEVRGGFRRAGRALAVRRATVRVLAPPGWISRARTRVGAMIDRVFGGDAALVRALVLAEQFDLEDGLRTRWADAGIIHMVSVSGLHVSIIATALISCFGLSGLPRGRAEAAALAVLAAYIAFIGAPPPAVRSAVMTALTVLARWLQRPPATWAVWGIGSGVSLVEPRVVDDLGWQLSVAGMAGLVAAGRFTALVPVRTPLLRYVVEGGVATGIATIVSAPIIGWTFGRLSVASLVTNLAAAPLFNIAQPLLFVAVALGALPSVVHGVFVDASRAALWLVDLVARVGARLPFATIAVSPDVLTAGCLALVALGLVLAGAMRQMRVGLYVAMVAATGATWGPWIPGGSGMMELHVIDVGQGDAVALRTPVGRWVVVDVGPAWDGGDSGDRVVGPYLRRFRGDVAHLVLTHAHRDHTGGVPGLLKHVTVDSIWDGGGPGTEGLEGLRSSSRRPWGTLTAGDRLLVDGVTLEVLAPSPAWRDAQDDPNEASVVLRATWRNQHWLLTGDAEVGEEAWLVEHAVLGASVLKVGHHGSRTSTSPAFLAAVAPRVALISLGRDNDYGHPADEVLRRFDAAGVHVLRTDDDGSIVLTTDGRTLTVRVEGEAWTYSAASPKP